MAPQNSLVEVPLTRGQQQLVVEPHGILTRERREGRRRSTEILDTVSCYGFNYLDRVMDEIRHESWNTQWLTLRCGRTESEDGLPYF